MAYKKELIKSLDDTVKQEMKEKKNDKVNNLEIMQRIFLKKASHRSSEEIDLLT